MPNLKSTATIDEVVETIDRDGYAVIEQFLDRTQAREIRDELTRVLAETPKGRNDFEGYSTKRIYALFAKTRAFDGPATHPTILGVLDRVLGASYQLSAPVGIEIAPGETAQPLHCDDAVYPLPRPHKEVIVNTMWALDDFTEVNGATRVVPGSHKWVEQRPDDASNVVQAVMPAGSVMFFIGSVYHGGGANNSDRPRLGTIIEYVAGWLRQQENQLLAVPPHIVRSVPTRLQELIGYNIHPPFIGNVDGRHPLKVLNKEEGLEGL